MTFQSVLDGERLWSVEQSDCLPWLCSLPADCCSLILTSPPYELARTYFEGGKNLGIARKTDAWVKWLVEVWGECQRVCTGLVAMVVEGQTKKYRYSAGPLLLAAELHRAGFHLRKPPAFVRVGIPGSGGPDWIRNDYEFIICTARPGKLPWSDNTACGNAPKYAPGGEMSHRLSSGTRVNQWGKTGSMEGKEAQRRKDGTRQKAERPSHVVVTVNEPVEELSLFGDSIPQEEPDRNAHGVSKTTTRRRTGTDQREQQNRKPIFRHSEDEASPTDHDRLLNLAIANPGNVIEETYTAADVFRMFTGAEMQDSFTAEEVHALLAEKSDVTRHNVGGGNMGHPLAHDNEAPYPLSLCEVFVRSFCKPGDVCCDIFSGSGTTGHAAVMHGRKFIGCDLRESQVKLARRRIGDVTPPLFTE